MLPMHVSNGLHVNDFAVWTTMEYTSTASYLLQGTVDNRELGGKFGTKDKPNQNHNCGLISFPKQGKRTYGAGKSTSASNRYISVIWGQPLFQTHLEAKLGKHYSRCHPGTCSDGGTSWEVLGSKYKNTEAGLYWNSQAHCGMCLELLGYGS